MDGMTPSSGVVPLMVEVAEPGAHALYETGPDIVEDLRRTRPYFLVPLDFSHRLASVRDRILAWAEHSSRELVPDPATGAIRPKGPVTDLYVLSHGWHRSFFSAVEAYDRVVSRVAVLLHRGRILASTPYHPIFVTLHWHSDPGQDQWVDPSGRRHKASFLRNVETMFEQPSAAEEARAKPGETFTDVFEDVYEVMARMSAPDTLALDSEFDEPAARLARAIARYPLREAPGATLYDRVAVVWHCYCRATARRVLMDQDEAPRRYVGPVQAVMGVAKFAVASVGVVAVAGALLKVPWKGIAAWSRSLWAWIPARLSALPVLGASIAHVIQVVSDAWDRWLASPVWGLLLGVWCGFESLSAARQWLLVTVLAWLVLEVTAAVGRAKGRLRPARGAPIAGLVSWVVLQIALFVPLLVYVLVTYVLGGLASCVRSWRIRPPGLFDERFGVRNATTCERRGVYPRYWLAQLARYPLRRMRQCVAADSSVNATLDALDAQLAFWEMQRRGVQTGRAAAEFLADLLAADTSGVFRGARIHLMGHSFGGLVVCNAVRNLALDDDLLARFRAGDPERKVSTLTIVEGALSTGWFESEDRTVALVKDAIACIFSRYDMANGFYYPLACHSRMAAGYVGLISGDPVWPERRERFLSLASPPNLDDPSYMPHDAVPPNLVAAANERGGARVWNLDASRLIYEGNVALGGGHGDIFKDDVTHLVWAVMSSPHRATVT